MATKPTKTDEEFKADMDRLRKRVRNLKEAKPEQAEIANCFLGLLDLLADEL